MDKKTYEMPTVVRVHLEIKNSVLSVCHSSMIGDSSSTPEGCRCPPLGICALGDPGTGPWCVGPPVP